MTIDRPNADRTGTDRARAGLRRATPAGQRALAIADTFTGLPEGITRWRLAAALRAAARPLGLTAPMLRLLELYIDLTYDIDWTAGSEPIVARPLIEIAEHLGKSERQVRNIERALMERGLICWRDSGNHHRKSRRDRRSGRLIYAYGPSLAPLAHRGSEILTLADEARQQVTEARRCRIAISALRRRIKATVAELDPDRVSDITAELARIPARNRAGEPIETLTERRDALAALAARLEDHLASSTTTGTDCEIAAVPEIFSRPISDTYNRSSMNGCSPATRRPLGRQVLEDRSTPASAANATVQLGLALRAATADLRRASSEDGQATWASLADAARERAMLHGIDEQLWGSGCERIGRTAAALCVLIIDRGALRRPGERHEPIRQPPAYFRALLDRADNGSLQLHRSIMTLARRSDRASPDACEVQQSKGQQ